jgi:TonB family protein
MTLAVGSLIAERTPPQRAGMAVGWRFIGKAMTALAILLAHMGIMSLLRQDPIDVRRLRADYEPMFAELITSDARPETRDPPIAAVLDPSLELQPPALPPDAIPKSQVVAPRIDPEWRLDLGPFISRAQLDHNEVVTVLMILQIAADGSVISAAIVRSNGDDAANSAAIDYAKTTRWIAGEVDGESQPMQASLTVILGEAV